MTSTYYFEENQNINRLFRSVKQNPAQYWPLNITPASHVPVPCLLDEHLIIGLKSAVLQPDVEYFVLNHLPMTTWATISDYCLQPPHSEQIPPICSQESNRYIQEWIKDEKSVISAIIKSALSGERLVFTFKTDESNFKLLDKWQSWIQDVPEDPYLKFMLHAQFNEGIFKPVVYDCGLSTTYMEKDFWPDHCLNTRAFINWNHLVDGEYEDFDFMIITEQTLKKNLFYLNKNSRVFFFGSQQDFNTWNTWTFEFPPAICEDLDELLERYTWSHEYFDRDWMDDLYEWSEQSGTSNRDNHPIQVDIVQARHESHDYVDLHDIYDEDALHNLYDD